MEPSDAKSISAAIVQIAKLLRTQTHAAAPKKRAAKVLGPSNKIEQIAKLLRDEIRKSDKTIPKD
jgi:hypothetical protein